MVVNALIGLVALMHIGFLILEMFLWRGPVGRKVFGLKPEFAQESAKLAANQGLYNGFLAAGLIWGLMQGPAGFDTKVFFLGCVIVAAVFGALTVKPTILIVQGLPAVVALAALMLL